MPSTVSMVFMAIGLVIIILLVCVLVSNSRNRHVMEELAGALDRTKPENGEMDKIEQFAHLMTDLERAIPRLAIQAGRRGAEEVMLGAGYEQRALAATGYVEEAAGSGQPYAEWQPPHEEHQPHWHADPEAPAAGHAPAPRDHSGARAQLGVRADRPIIPLNEYTDDRPLSGPPPGYTEVYGVSATDVPDVRQIYSAPQQAGDEAAADPEFQKADTEIFSAITGADHDEFSDEEFLRKPGESDEEYEARKVVVTARYEASLRQQRMETTGSFQAGLGTTTAVAAREAVSRH